MQIPDLLSQLDHLQNKNEQQASRYLLEIQQYMKAHSGRKWSPRHEAVFRLLQKRIADAVFYRRLFVGVSVLMLLTGLYIGARWYFSWEDYLTESALLEMARTSSLPLELEQPDPGQGFLTVKIARNFPGLGEARTQHLTDLLSRFPSLGRHYMLGENARLLPELLPAENKLLIREAFGGIALGKLALTEGGGTIWPTTGINALLARQQFRLGTAIAYHHEGQPAEFYLQVVGIEKDRWQLRFSEDALGWSKSFYLEKTSGGDIEAMPFLVYEEGWKGIHVVAIGIGKYGEEDAEGYAWQIKSFVRTIGLGE